MKLFKYDKETDDFNTTTFNVQQALNNNWDKIDSKYEDTEKEITTLKEVDEDIYKQLERLQFLTQISDIERYDKDDKGIYRNIAYRTPNPVAGQKGKLTALSELSMPDNNGLYTGQKIVLYNEREGAYRVYYFKLIYKDGDFIERKVERIV
ncbi:hypothetical protein FDA45_05735 [Clostridium botulinum]|uniref:hypothetical protein n=1 Tax=Clostridium botulinum TaxID=1491 RepID=UPI00138F2CFF|nr:hypothetical protein [Clostridium botulinum]MBY7003572.1 hypothetical protein [Clostridium botulinum]NFH93173.1 hypothetical protein [Clostridium botulinum]NFI24588.1 hypothetical protein [Clostridium botulinum]NFI36293.1 hypothetical protein [Clostridium botulinum]NFM87387.1 hypothetical protein [Clostridium botulinum]